MSKARDLADFISTGSILSDGTIESTEISGVTADATEINKLDGLTADTAELNKLDGVTATTAELNKLAGTTATTSDFDKLSNVTASATELNYMSGATSSIQNQLDNISVTSGSLTKSFTNGETASITLSSALSTAPVVGVTKEVAQTGISSKGAWDVNATASNYDLHNTAYATTLTPSQIAASDISQATYANKTTGNLGFGLPRGLWFKPDGTQFFILDHTNAQILTYDLSTAWDVSTKTYNTAYTFTVGISTAGGTQPMNFWFNSTGTSLYVSHVTSVFEHTLSTAWDVSTISYVTGSNFYTGNSEGDTRGFWWKPDGTKMFVVGTLNDTVYEYHFSTGFDFSTGNQSTAQASFSVASQAGSPRDVQFNSTGTTMYITNDTGGIYEYSLSTAWDVTTASYTSNVLDVSSTSATPQAIYFGNGNLYITTDTNDAVHQYNFSSDGLVLGTGSFASTDVGKRIQGNGGDVILTSTAGSYDTTGGSDFTDTSTIASGSWTMHGLKSAGDADGLTLPGIIDVYNFNSISYNNVSQSVSGQITNSLGIRFSSDGTKMYISDSGGTGIVEYNLSTANDITTASYSGATLGASGWLDSFAGIAFKTDGTAVYVCGYYSGDSQTYIMRFNLSTAWDLSTASHSASTQITSEETGPVGICFKPDGTSVYIVGDGNDYIRQYNLSTAWDITTKTHVASLYVFSQSANPRDLDISNDGSKMYMLDDSDYLFEYSLTTPYDLTTASYTNNSFLFNTDAGVERTFTINSSGTKIYTVGGSADAVYEYNFGSAILPTSQYHIGVTNTNGQIDSSFWTDINSMTADQSLGDGEAYYAVSTDDRTTWSVAKGSDGVRPIVRDNAGTWQYNSDAGSVTGYDISSPTYTSKTLAINTYLTSPQSFTWGNNGAVLFVCGQSNDKVFGFNLSTAYDLSTATVQSASGFSVGGQTQIPRGVLFNENGTKLYVLSALSSAASGGSVENKIYEYSMSTAYDSTTLSYVATYDFTSHHTNAFDMTWNGDGTKFYTVEQNGNLAHTFSLTTAYDMSTASYVSGATRLLPTNVTGLHFNSDGTVLFFSKNGSVIQHNLTTAYDITTSSDSGTSWNGFTSQDSSAQAVIFNNDGTRLYILGTSTDSVYEYDTSSIGFGTNTTWTNATTNDEFYALQEALGATSVNRMDKTQLDAVADGSHFTLGDTLDLAIALKQDTASASLPTSDGVTINYDAQALNQGAVLGTDYDYDFPDSTTVRITSNAAQNLKIRVV
jgi:hypothetical protein